MKSSEIVIILKKCAKILELFDDIPLTEALDKLYSLAQKNTKIDLRTEEQNGTAKIEKTCTIDDALIEQMAGMNSEELLLFLQDTTAFKSKAELMNLAEKLSITSSKRHNIETLRHFIVTYFERGRMDQIFKNERNAE
ncbi:hypothetical protein [Oscillibacter sp.]|uniref:hypothetical protein n=1 Tax=Oscillibacter sp. TaxID=1945593 RepID=UPI0028A7CFAE|nr:hypothetical protein [Oscillibacter sp.]